MKERPAPPRPSSTRFALLGVLAMNGGQNGYQLRAAIERSVGFFWSESFGQIYPQLDAMAADGLVEPVASHSSRTVRRRRITAQGRSALRRWLEAPPLPRTARDELLLKLFFGRFAAPETCRNLIAQARASAEQRLAQLREAERQVLAEADTDLAYSLIAIDLGLRAVQATLAWVKDAESLLAASEGGSEAQIKHAWRALDDARHGPGR
ncbi:MAG: PadR family transcriptional regulator [Alphaproteobacteria bacterium]